MNLANSVWKSNRQVYGIFFPLSPLTPQLLKIILITSGIYSIKHLLSQQAACCTIHVLRQQIKKSWKSRQFLTSISNFYLRKFFYIQDFKMKDEIPGLKFRGGSDGLRWNRKKRKKNNKTNPLQIEYLVALTVTTGLRIRNAVSAPWSENIKDLNTIDSDGNRVFLNTVLRKTPWNERNILQDCYLAGWHRDDLYI